MWEAPANATRAFTRPLRRRALWGFRHFRRPTAKLRNLTGSLRPRRPPAIRHRQPPRAARIFPLMISKLRTPAVLGLALALAGVSFGAEEPPAPTGPALTPDEITNAVK